MGIWGLNLEREWMLGRDGLPLFINSREGKETSEGGNDQRKFDDRG